MLYGLRRESATIIGAADDMAEFERFKTACEVNSDLYREQSQPDFMVMMTDPLFQKLKIPPLVFNHADEAQQKAFVAAHGIVVVNETRIIDRHDDMMASLDADPYAFNPNADPSTQRTIAQIHNLEENDPWDKRSDEAKEQDKIFKQKLKEAEQAGTVSSDSWGDGNEGEARVTDIHTSQNADGTVSVDKVRAQKGMHGKTVDEATAAERAAKRRDDAKNYGKSRNPRDYVFAISENNGETYVGICERNYFENEGKLNDWPITPLIGHVLGDLEEIEDATFLSDDGAYVRTALEAVGLTHSPDLEVLLGSFNPEEEAADGSREGVESPDDEASGDEESHGEEQAEIDPEHVVDPSGETALFHKVEVTGASLSAVASVLDDETNAMLDVTQFASRDTQTGCWFAFKRAFHADKLYQELLRLGLDVEKAFGVNHNGERLVPKGSSVEVVDVDAEKDYGPRPWNDRAAEFDLLSDDEKKAVWEKIKGEEFIFCGSYRGAEYGSVIHVAPVEWFNKHGTMWENTAEPRPLNIGHVLPADLKEHVPGTYVSRSRDWNALTLDLARKGMVENMFLQLHLNNQ